MKQKITALASELKISATGFCRTADYDVRAFDSAKSSFAKNVCRKAEEILPGAHSAIVCAFGYYTGEKSGNISRYAQGIDYHKVAAEKLNRIAQLLNEYGFSAAAFADTGELNERMLANLAGIAFIGKNRMAINTALGSYFFIGYVLTDCVIEPNAPCTDTCMECNACVRACPLGALDGGFDEKKCLSYITQKKGDLTKTEQNAVKQAGMIWGCDICQEVCPHNRMPIITEIDEFKNNLIYDLHVDENLSNREFKRIYGDRAFAWRGKNVLVRNQKILENE